MTWKSDTTARPCHCVGPQNGQPFCPCEMQRVAVVDGRYVKDMGPAARSDSEERTERSEAHKEQNNG